MTRNGPIASIAYGPTDLARGPEQSRTPNKSATTLRAAAKLVENTAFSEAGIQDTAVISQLITAAAELERLAQIIERRAERG